MFLIAMRVLLYVNLKSTVAHLVGLFNFLGLFSSASGSLQHTNSAKSVLYKLTSKYLTLSIHNIYYA